MDKKTKKIKIAENIIVKKFISSVIFTLLFVSVGVLLFSCTENTEKNENENIETYDTKDIFTIEAANQFAVDKETEVPTAEETKAHHIYPEDYNLKNSSELVIGDKEFLTKINYIYNHIDDFKETDVIIEGMYGIYESWDKTFSFPMVYRNGPGCCGDDQYGGFYLVNIDMTAYEIDDWIEVKGRPFMYEHTDSEGEIQKFMFLLVAAIEKKDIKERKAEMVNN